MFVLRAHNHCSRWCQATILCHAVPCWTTASLLPTSTSSSSTPRSCRDFDHLYSRCSSGCPHHRILEMSPTETGTTGEPRVAEGELGTGHAGSAMSLPRVLILLCPSSLVPLPSSAVPRMSCDLSQFQCAPVQPFPLEPCPGLAHSIPIEPCPGLACSITVQLFPIAPCPRSSHPNQFIPSRFVPVHPVPVRAAAAGGATRHNSATCRSRRGPPGTGESLTHLGWRDPGDPPSLGDPDPSRLEGYRGPSKSGGP